MNRLASSLLSLLFASLILPATMAHAEDSAIYIDVGQAQVKKSLLALTPFQYLGTQTTNEKHLQAGQNLFRVVYNDLSVSNYFTYIANEAYLEDPNRVGLRPSPGAPNGFDFSKWKTIGTEFLVRGAYQVLSDELVFEVYVYHVPTTKLILGKTYRSPISGLRKLGHIFSNDFVKALTGKRGPFVSKIVASRQEGSGHKEIYVMDWDGANVQKITSHQSIAISPAWSFKGDKIAYTAFAYHKNQKVRNADLFTYDLATGQRLLVSYRKGINSGAAFLPGDREMLLTLSQDGSPDIFRMNIDGTNMRPLTRGPNRSMNVEPAISPDGQRIAFSSDRSGRPMVFVMNVDGSAPKRLTFVGKFNASPSWSPDGKTIAFAGQDQDHFDIFTMNADGSNLKRLTNAKKPNGRLANNESPSWAPDGRNILFTSDRTGRYQLYMVSPDGNNERRITDDNFNWDKPKWSSFLD